MRNLLGGKRLQPCGDDKSWHADPAGIYSNNRSLHRLLQTVGKQITKEIQDQIFEALTWLEGCKRKEIR